MARQRKVQQQTTQAEFTTMQDVAVAATDEWVQALQALSKVFHSHLVDVHQPDQFVTMHRDSDTLFQLGYENDRPKGLMKALKSVAKNSSDRKEKLKAWQLVVANGYAHAFSIDLKSV